MASSYLARHRLWLLLYLPLSLSVAKKPMLDEGILSVEQMGIIGSILLYVYALGKFSNGYLSDRANIRRFMSTAPRSVPSNPDTQG